MSSHEQSVEVTRSVLTRYFESDHADADMMADDVVFTIMATSEEHRGRKAVLALLEYFYHQAFTAAAEPHVHDLRRRACHVRGDIRGPAHR